MNDYLKYSDEASVFEEALMLGNGRVGATHYGGAVNDRFSINEATLWSGYPEMERAPENAPETFKRMQKLALENKREELEKLSCASFSGTSSQCFLPFCNLRLIAPEGEVSGYERLLDMRNGISEAKYKIDGVKIRKQAFVDFSSGVLAIRIEAEKNQEELIVSLDSLLQCVITATDEKDLILRGTAPMLEHIIGARYDKRLRPKYYEDKEKKGMRFCGMVFVKTDGEKKLLGNDILLENFKSAEIFFSGATSFNGFDKHPFLEGKDEEAIACSYLSEAIEKGFDKMKEEHKALFSDLYSRCELNISEEDKRNTDEILSEGSGNSRYELLFNVGKYLTISASRGSEPANLQGIWNEHLIAPWKSNYTTNINTEMNYFPTLRLGLFECFEPYVRLVRELAIRGERVAKDWYGIEGIVAHHNCDLWRKAEPAGDGMENCGSYSFWNGAFSWMLSAVFEKYEKQEDIEFLKSIHPLLLKASNAWLELSVEDEEGRRFVCPATSPENSFLIDGKRLSVTKTAAMSNAIARDILRKTLISCEILGDEENHKKYKALLDSFMPDRITESGRIMEWDEDLEEAEPEHRHVSHLFALHPGNEITPEKAPELSLACERSLEARGDDGTGWCIAWKANMWARLEKGERARKLLDTQLRLCSDKNTIYTKGGGTYPNMLCAHPPFQIDGNFGATAAILEMLARNEGKRIYILPALPKAWENGEIKGIRLNGNAILNLSWKNGKAQKIEILPKEKAENYEIIK